MHTFPAHRLVPVECSFVLQTLLYRVPAENLETFLDRCQSEDHKLPRYVEKELRDYLSCGVLGHGFVRLKCSGCGKEERAPAFSCKGRGFCPSCTGRRMADTAARLVDNVFPENVPVRQWVLSLPLEIRYRLAYDSKLLSDVWVEARTMLSVRCGDESCRGDHRPVFDPTLPGRNRSVGGDSRNRPGAGAAAVGDGLCGLRLRGLRLLIDPGLPNSEVNVTIHPSDDFTHLNRMFLVSSNRSRGRIW